jgi:phosphoglycolate phosphatase-like HAD superfamily hydrolase
VPYSPRAPLLIWDIDGTLLEAKGTGRRALNSAFEALYHVPDAFNGLDFAGASDHDLLRQAQSRYAPDAKASQTIRFFCEYLPRLDEALRAHPLKPLPGVVSLIACLSRIGWPLAVGTGNVRAGAYHKLSFAGLANYFPDGGFSEPGQSRQMMLHKVHHTQGSDRPAIVIGDTPTDITAAHACGLPIIAVATGRFHADVLRQAGADGVLDSLDCRTDFFDAVLKIAGK